MLVYPICVYLHLRIFVQCISVLTGNHRFHDQDGMFGSDWLPGTFGEHEGGSQVSLFQNNEIIIVVVVVIIVIVILILIIIILILIIIIIMPEGSRSFCRHPMKTVQLSEFSKPCKALRAGAKVGPGKMYIWREGELLWKWTAEIWRDLVIFTLPILAILFLGGCVLSRVLSGCLHDRHC